MLAGDSLALSVVMPVYNGEDYLQASIESIVRQSFGNFEFVILDDGSTDRTPQILSEWAGRDGRIRVISGRPRRGVVGSANRVVREARAPICARMDADDVSHPDRLRRQWEVLRSHPDACLVATLSELIDRRGRVVRSRDRSTLLRGGLVPPFPHGSIMFRRGAFEAAGGYRQACTYWEDRDLFIRMAQQGRILVLPAPLYRLRCHAKSARLSASSRDLRDAFRLMHRCLAAHRAGRDYTALLDGSGGPGGEPDDVALQWFSLLGSLRLWAGLRPGILRPLLSRDGVRVSGASLRVLALAALGEVSPRLYRRLHQGVHRLRDRRAARVIDEQRPVEWRLQ